MTKFCENCPLKYQACGEIDAIAASEGVYENRMLMGRGGLLDSHSGLNGVLVDDRNNPSWPMKFPGHNLDAALVRYKERINNCDGPIIETQGLFRKREFATGCSALGPIAIQGTASAQILRAVRVELA